MRGGSGSGNALITAVWALARRAVTVEVLPAMVNGTMLEQRVESSRVEQGMVWLILAYKCHAFIHI